MINQILNKLSDDYHQIIQNRLVVTYLNLYQYQVLRKEKSIIRNIDYFIFDGFLLPKFLFYFGYKKYKCLQPDFSGFFNELFNYCIRESKSVALVGGNEEDNLQTSNFIKEKFPDLKVSLRRSGFITSSSDEKKLLEKLVSKSPDYLLIGMGVPRQEIFMCKLKAKQFKGTSIACGGFYHQTSKKGDYYPDIVKILGIRWLYRIVDEPKLAYRYFIIYPTALFSLAKDIIQYKLKRFN
jgi:N-acetylglucosaminyldiphosphoundecaprenol N-acetyl-beta-D-mannosaminyltransferase